MVCEAGDPVTTSVQGVMPVPLLIPKVQVHVVSAVSQALERPVMVHAVTSAIMDTELALS